jgi:Rod binding domain-containing protein
MHVAAHTGMTPTGAAHTGITPAGVAHTASAGAQAAAQPRLVKAAHEFEAQLMQELMKPLTRGGAPGDENGDKDSEDGGGLGSAGALGEFASEAMARAVSEQGGFGIANRIIAQLSHRSEADASRLGNECEQERENGKEHLRPKIKNLR